MHSSGLSWGCFFSPFTAVMCFADSFSFFWLAKITLSITKFIINYLYIAFQLDAAEKIVWLFTSRVALISLHKNTWDHDSKIRDLFLHKTAWFHGKTSSAFGIGRQVSSSALSVLAVDSCLPNSLYKVIVEGPVNYSSGFLLWDGCLLCRGVAGPKEAGPAELFPWEVPTSFTSSHSLGFIMDNSSPSIKLFWNSTSSNVQ